MLQGLLSGAGWFFLFLVIHVLWFHMVHVERCAKLILNTFACCFAGHVVTIGLLSGGRSLDQAVLRAFYGALVMGCLFSVYMPFYYTIATSLSVQTLICLEEAPGRSLSVPLLRKHFASTGIVRGRLNVMVANGYLTEKSGRYRVTRKGYLIARLFRNLKNMWRLGSGG